MKKPIRLKHLLNTAFTELGIDKEIKKWELVRDFKLIVGESIGQHTQAYRIADEVIYIKVDNPVWLSQLYLIKDEIIKKLNQYIGDDLVKDIKFSITS
ncbi:MAG: DUF721 domain-containing protein [candidate division WOR-3 bacterium]